MYRHRQRPHAFGRFKRADIRVVEDEAAGFHLAREFLQRGPVHGHQHVRFRHDRRADGFAGNHHRAVGGSAALLGAVGGIPRDESSALAGGAGENHAHAQDPLAAEAGHFDVDGADRRVALGVGREFDMQIHQAVQRFLAVVAGGAHDGRGFRRAVAEHAERIFLFHLLGDKAVGFLRRLPLVGQARHQDFDEGVAEAVALNFQRLADGLSRLMQLGHAGERHAGDIFRRLQLPNQFGHVQGIAHVGGVAAAGTGLRFFAHERGWGHLAAGHAIHGIIDEKHGDFFASVGRLNGFVQANGRQVTIALIGNDDGMVARARQAGADGRRAAVRHLDVAGVKIVVGEHRATDGADDHGAVLQAHVGQRFANQFVQYAVLTARAVVRGRLSGAAFAREGFVESAGLNHFFLHRRFHLISPQSPGFFPEFVFVQPHARPAGSPDEPGSGIPRPA